MAKNLTASDRKSLIRLASALPAGSPERRAILAGLQKAPVAKSAANATPAVEALMRDLGRIPGVDTVYITDTWSDGYFQLRVVLEPKEGPNALGGRSGKTIEFEYARGRWGKFFNIPNFAKIMAAIRKMVKKSDLTIDGIAGPKKVYEFQDRASKGSPRLSGYDDNEVAVELYDYSGARRASGKQARVKSKRESMRLMNGLEKQHGGRTKAYYEAVLKGVKDGVIAPSAVVGGGYKDGKKVAIKWLEGEIKSAPAKTAKTRRVLGAAGAREFLDLAHSIFPKARTPQAAMKELMETLEYLGEDPWLSEEEYVAEGRDYVDLDGATYEVPDEVEVRWD